MAADDETTICVECQDTGDPVTPENGVWLPGPDGDCVPVHNECGASWTLNQEHLTLG
jgi:hypothetical protein